ncbi:tRNA (adenosine(37)-N6)-dimethylallyltransferase MiaA [Bacillus horti]|uniref:tRNA dimethylallyltransferase n=1 Tax=Caldalkalibacillus horti TaxID=77523 RepID=A0ABT9VV20_9BACI|nr:tRNA (adenosine(37)-N6)-dimethylallyltransferase MiaA [Bacillus horti]MDQ0164823.1 tRNA dimethylallyltransferase [Bacillus horti]
MKQPLVSIIGPTSVGKTDLSIHIAKRLQGEIISGDSMQVYKGMDIGTAKVTQEEMQEVPHHLIDILEPNESFSVSDFQSLASEKISEICERGKVPILVGGTGLYVQSITHGFSFAENGNNDIIRKKWNDYLEEHGADALYEQIQQRDPEFAKTLHPNNARRVIRALEVLEVTGQSMAQFQGDWQNESPYQLVMLGLTMDREKLYQRINRRVDQMLQDGLIEELQGLLEQGVPLSAQSFQAIGYKEIMPYLKGECTKEEAVDLLKRNTRRFAKRQLTWFRRVSEITWFDVTDLSQWSGTKERITEYVKESLSQ